MKATRFGEDGWLVDCEKPLALAAALTGRGLDEVVPGDHVLLIRGDEQTVAAALANLPEQLPQLPVPDAITLPARWDGSDLGFVAQAAGWTEQAVIDALRATRFTVAFCGFSAGFAYMTGLPDALHIPRRDRPRPRVPAGSIAIAAGYCAVYPTESPGGWHILGTCSVRLFDPQMQPPALLQPGSVVRFS